MEGTRTVGVVADLQCGGWSTTLLNSIGQLYAVGLLDGMHARRITQPSLRRLSFPLGYPPTDRGRYEPTTAIREYSCGRTHVLGLSDSGKIWQWNDNGEPAKHIKFLHTDILENSHTGGHGTITRVVAGWDRATAYVSGTGIVYWDPENDPEENSEATDGLLIDAIVVPGTGYQRRKGERLTSGEGSDRIGEVRKYIVLEGYIVFITDLNKAFAARPNFPDNGIHQVIELTTLGDSLHNRKSELQDLQGSFRNFAVFSSTGEVFTADCQFIETFWENALSNEAVHSFPRPAQIPALQHTNVTSVAFGDYHYHALYSNGQVSSFGTEPQSCGALGLGDRAEGGMFRGVRYRQHLYGDGSLVPQAYRDGHRIWFEPEKRDFLRHMTFRSHEPEARQRLRLAFQDEQVNGELSEWFEQEGRGWDDFKDLKDAEDSGLGAYFVLSIAAAGWHSGALVLVDEERAQKVRDKYLFKPSLLPEASGDETNDSEEQTSVVGRTIRWIYQMGRSFLGLDTQSVQHGVGPRAGHTFQESPKDPEYIWRDQPFPRIKLSTGDEMPGTVPLSQWRYGVPDFTALPAE